MTDTIDLDDVEIDDGEDDGEPDANHGDWLWRGEGDPADEPDPPWADARSSGSADESDAVGEVDEQGAGADGAGDDSDAVGEAGPTDDGDETPTPRRAPRVPGGPSGPVGVPEDRGGAGGGSSSSSEAGVPEEGAGVESAESSPRTTDHGAATDADEMTLALTFEAANRLADPRFAFADARGWADWIGVVGTVSTPAIRKFQRDHEVELDFFGGSETGPAERLADVTPESMFHAERMVLVGTEGDEAIAEAAGWEFVALETAAEKADWSVEHPE
ncbi:hypothetical protein [Halovivax sp.]|uniref:DUF7124 domain-containing protein n=1 Tax=Halovivax sp. TaxID=1935978 RepID=UPI0025BFAA2A|nr:hypothetical protein [Halovivax sp.]